MKRQIETLTRLAQLRNSRVQQIQARLNYQRGLCQRYRNNIEGLSRLCNHRVPMTTPLQRDNQQRYQQVLHGMLQGQRNELTLAEQTLERIQQELLQALRSELAINTHLDTKLTEWQRQLASQEQKIQDGLAAQSWWRHRQGELSRSG